MNNREANLAALATIAHAIGDLNDEAVYVGGAVVGLYVEPDNEDSRPTKDVDLFLEITTSHRLEAVREKMYKQGFKQTPEDDVLCRFRYADIKVDVMSTAEIGWAPANEWFSPGMKDTITVLVSNHMEVRLLKLPFFLATKLAAFEDRADDPRTSHDMEDIIYILDGNSSWEASINEAPNDLREYLQTQLQLIEFETAQAHLPDSGRVRLILDRIATLG